MRVGRSRNVDQINFDPFNWLLFWIIEKIFMQLILPTIRNTLPREMKKHVVRTLSGLSIVIIATPLFGIMIIGNGIDSISRMFGRGRPEVYGMPDVNTSVKCKVQGSRHTISRIALIN